MKRGFIMEGCPSGLFGGGPVTLSEGLQNLIDEHIPLRRSLDNLLSLCNKVETEEKKEDSFSQLNKEVREFNENLKHHSVREEDHLFKMMETYLGKSGGPLAVMEYEHERAHGFINEFLKNTEGHSKQTTDDMVKNATLIKDAYLTLTEHFSKEEQVLYPMAERMFSQEEKDLLKQKVLEK